MKKYALIVAGGSGLRMGSDIPKQFIELNKIPVLMHTLNVFSKFDNEIEIILVLPENHIDYWNELCIKYGFTTNHKIVAGGSTRFYSVKKGLSQINDSGIVFIHDGVRPLVSGETLLRCLETATKSGNAIPVMPANESLRKMEGENTVAVDRRLFLNVQTPQTFRSEQILAAFEQTFSEIFTDDASVAEKAGFTINIVEGNKENIKITDLVDLIFASALLIK